MLNDILILDQQWLPNQSDFPPISWPWYRSWPSPIMSGFHGAFATGVACQQGTLTLPDTWFRPPFWDLLMLQLSRPNSSNLPCLYSTLHLEYPLVLSRFCLTYWAEILHMTLFYHTTDQVRVSSICVNFCGSYAPFGRQNRSTEGCWNLEYWKYTVFRTFLLHALIYWAEILHMTLFYCTIDQVWVSSIFVGVMPLLELRILKIHNFLHFSHTCFDILSWNFAYDFV